ncbi:hypothetical protein BC826DRAFT_1183958 [Russula brevipes]|nr:hypothetical protein BC826DRAFT_1183958 [Russula brevipes]
MTRGRRSGHQDAGPSHGALDSGPGPLGDTTASFRGGSPSSRPRVASPGGSRCPDRARLRPLSRLTLGLRPQTIRALQTSALNFGHAPSATRRPPEEAHPQNHGLRPCPGWPTTLWSSAFAQATTVCSAAPQTFPSSSESCPKPPGLKFVGFAPQVFRVRASDHPSSPSDDSRFPRTTIHVTRPARRSPPLTVANTALPVQCERRRAPRCQCNANGGEHHAASATQTAASTNGSKHRAANATRTAASTALPAQHKRR